MCPYIKYINLKGSNLTFLALRHFSSGIACVILLIFVTVGSRTSSHTHAVHARAGKITQSSTCERAPFFCVLLDNKNLSLQFSIKRFGNLGSNASAISHSTSIGAIVVQ
jgi:hypothetical protein